MPHLPLCRYPLRRILRSFQSRCHPPPNAVLGVALPLPPAHRRLEASGPSHARSPRNRSALHPLDAATTRHSVRNTSVRTATRVQNCLLLLAFSLLLLRLRASRCEPGRLRCVLPEPEGCSRKKKPCAGRHLKAATERRARFSYDDLLGYLIVELTSWPSYSPCLPERVLLDCQQPFM